MQDSVRDDFFMEDQDLDVPTACPSYTEASIVDQAVPFIIFLSKYSNLKDRLSAAEVLDDELSTWRERYNAQQALLACLHKQLDTCQQGSQRWQRLLLPKNSMASKLRNIQAESADLQTKKGEVAEAMTECQTHIDRIVEAIAARQTLREQCARQQAKLDKVYDKAFDKKEHEYTEESSARRDVAAAKEDVKSCSERLSKARSANESLREALHHALLCTRAFDAAQSSSQQTMIMPTPAPAHFKAQLRRAIGHERCALDFFRKAIAADPYILNTSSKLRVLAETFGARLESENTSRNNSNILSFLNTSSAAHGNDVYTRASELRPLVGESVTYLARERRALRNRLHTYEQQYNTALREVTAAEDRLRNIRRTLFVDTLRGQDRTMADPFLNQDQVTLLKWLKDALDAGRLSVPTAAGLSNAMLEADHEDLPSY